VNSLLPAVPRLSHGDSLDVQYTTHICTSLVARIEWCRKLEMQVHTEAELEGWCAEEEGLRDAVLNRDRTFQFRYRSCSEFERYAMGLEDGRALMRAAWVECI
jgi:hypothetical protein